MWNIGDGTTILNLSFDLDHFSQKGVNEGGLSTGYLTDDSNEFTLKGFNVDITKDGEVLKFEFTNEFVIWVLLLIIDLFY